MIRAVRSPPDVAGASEWTTLSLAVEAHRVIDLEQPVGHVEKSIDNLAVLQPEITCIPRSGRDAMVLRCPFIWRIADSCGTTALNMLSNKGELSRASLASHCFTSIPCLHVSWITDSGLSAKKSSTARFAPGHEINP